MEKFLSIYFENIAWTSGIFLYVIVSHWESDLLAAPPRVVEVVEPIV